MKIFCDFDDTLVRSSKKVVEIINSDFGTSKTEDDVKDWGYKSIYHGMNKQIIDKIFADERFFINLEFFDGALEFLSNRDVEFCTLGTKENLKRKYNFLKENFPSGFSYSGLEHGDKSSIDMSGGIQIDDKVSYLENTNASVKILFRNYKNLDYQIIPPNSNIYSVNSWEEIEQLVSFLEGFNEN